jgi:enoyl-CoA hydratase
MSEVLIRREGSTLFLDLDRPQQANSLSASAVEILLDAFSVAEESDVRLAVVRGNGKNFCAGFDLQDLESTSDAELMWRMIRLELLLQAVFHAPFLTLALAQGNAVGAGADLFCACSMRVSAPGTKFRMPGWGFGVALGTRRLVERIGMEKAREFLLRGEALN